MPDFDKDLNVKIEDVKSTPFDLTATAPKSATPYTQSLDRLDYSGATDVFARLREASQQSDPSGKGVFITNAELDANKRYETFNPTIPNYEDFAAYGQSVSDKAANGILKGLNLAATTVAGGFGMLYGAIRSPFSGRLADIWDNEVMRGLDDWNTKVDQEYLPNYYTDAEKNSAWYSTNNWFKANFLFDKLIKNSGFAVGAMVSGNIANAGLLRAGAALGKAAMAGATAAEASQAFKLFTPLLRNTARAFSAAKNVEAAAILEKEISSIADLTTKTSKLGELSKVTNAFGDFGNGARRTAIAAYSSAGEASFEAMQTSNEYRENLIQKYKDENYGQEPTEEILKDINVKSEKLGKASFFGNLAILGVTEYVQLPYILGSSYSATKKASNSLLGKIERTEMINGVETAIKPKTRFGKLYEKASGVGKYVFDPKEAAQEGLQYALQVGTQNYYNKAFEGNDADFLVDGVLYGLFGKDELGQGKGALVSKEGLEGMVLGGITGNLMQARGKYKESKQIAENTQRYLNEIKDAPTFRDAFKDRLRSINRNTVLQQEQQDVIVQGDKLEAKDLDADIAHNYLSTRIKYGRYEMVKDDINDLRSQSIDETGLSALKQQGMANVNDTLESFREKLNNFENVAKYTNEIYRSLDLRYSGEANEDGSRKYSPVVIDKMAYMSAKIANYDIRIPQLNAGLASNGIATFDVLENILEKNKPAKKVIADATAKIEELNIHPDLKTDLITNLKHIVELSLRRKLFLNEFENIKLNPEKYETLESTIEEFLSKSSLAAEFKNKEGVTEPVEVDREYQISKSKKALVDKIEDDKWQVTSPDGSVTFYPSKEKADEFAKTINAEFDGLDKIKILGINSEGKIKIEDSNGDIYYIDPAMLNGYEKVKSSQEKLLKDKNDIDAQQAEIENKSGDTSTGVPEEDEKKIVYEDGFRKILSRIFSSTTAQSEADPTKLIPSSKRANIFRNNLKNFKNKSNIRLILVTQKQEAALGLEGLANLSMGSVGTHTDIDNGFIAAVYVEQDGTTLYFVNEKGERTGKVGEKVALDKMIFDTMPSTSLSTPTGLRFDEKTTSKEDVQELANQWKAKREKLLNITGSPEMYSFDLSRGIPKISNKAAKNAVGKTLVSEDLISTQQGLIVIPTTKTITHQGETINFPNGRPVLQYEDTLQPLNNRKFNKKEANAIFLVMQYLCDSIKEQSEKGQKVKIDRNFATFLQSVLYYRKSADTAKNQFYIDTATMDFFFGGKMYDITKIAESKDAIIQQLLDVYNNVNNYTLTKDFDATFREYYINDKGQLVINNWENYQTYLMSSTYPNGTARPEQEIPLTTNVDKITDLAPTNYKAKYSILQGLELPQVVIAPVAPVAPVAPTPAPVIITPAPIVTPVVEPVAEKVLSDDEKVQSFITAKISDSLPGSYDLEGDIFEFKAGNISFTAKLNDKGKYDVTFDANDVDNRKTIDKIKDTPASMVVINNFIELGKPKAPEAPAPVVSNVEKLEKERDDELAALEENKPTTKFSQSFGDFTVYEGDDGSYDVLDNVEEGVIAEYVKTKEEAILIAKQADIERKRKKHLSLPIIKVEEKDTWMYNLGTFMTEDGEFNGVTAEDVIKKINDKYNAQLDVLKSKPTPPTGKKNFGKKKGGGAPTNSEFRKVGRNEENVEKMSDLDIQLFKEWHAKNASTIPYEILDGVIRINSTEKAWGAFEAGVAKFYKGAIRGTEYHEIFEGIWKAFLTSEQRQNILDEFRSQKGTFLDRESGKRISYDEATDLQAKERIADDFSEFRLGKLPGRTLKEKILKFFRDIINFFKSFVQNPSLKRDLFKDINKGKYNKRVISESVKNEPIEYSKIGNLTETQSYNFVQDITARVFQIIFSTNKSLYNLETINSGEIFNRIKDTYLEYGVIDDLDPDQLTSSEFDELVGRTKEFLRVFKIDFDHDGDASFNDDSRDRNEYASSPFVTDWKKLSPFAIKIVLASLTETVSTNQENKSLSLPKLKKDPETDTFKLLNFSRAFATCLSQFANTTDVSDLIDKLGELAKFDSNYVRLYTRLGGVANTEKAHINFAKFKMDDWRLFVNFYQTFSKQKPDALIQYINGGSVHTATANLFEAKKDIKSNWIENLKGMVGKPDSLITYNYETNAYKIKTRKKDKNNENESNGVLDFPIRSTQDKIAFLAKIGIEFPIEAYGKLKTRGKTNQVEEFGKAVSAIREYFGSNQDVLSFTGKTLGVNAQYDKLAELFVKVTNPNQELSFFGIDQKKIQAYAENNAISILENEFNSCKTLVELLALRPELRDLFSKHSVVLKKGGLFFNNAGKRIREFKVAYIQGTSDQDLGKDVVTTSLTLGNRYVQQLNQNLMGNYYILVPADSSTEWMMNLGNIIKFADVESQKGKFAREQMHEIFMGYLEDDIALALADRKQLINVAPRAKELRFFNDILSKELLKDVNQLIADDANTDQVETFLKDKDNIDKINASIDLYIKGYNDATIQTLKDTKRVVNGLKKNYKFIDLDADFSLAEKLNKEDLSEKELNDIVMFANVNYIINNIELHKLLFGDPYQFAIKDGQLDETKRTKAFLSGRRKMFNTPEFNTFLNNMNQAGTIEDIENNEGIKLRGPDVNDEDDFGDPGYHLNKSYANTVTFEDVEIIGSIATLDDIPSEIQKAYAKKAKETDGISFLMDGAYKEIKLKNGQWPREAEEWHQWQMAYTRQNFPGYVYKDAALEAHDKALVSKPEPKFMIDVLKPIVSGTEHNSTSIKLVLDKFSQMPLYFSMVKGTNLEKMYVNMFKQQIDYAVVLSGRKVGAGAAHPIYNKDGSFNETKYNNRVKVSWASYGIQVENAYQEGKQQPRGSQITKLVSIDIFDNGVATSERAQKEYDRNKKLLGLLHKNGYESFLKKLGIVDLGDGRFQLINNVAVSETLIHEMLRRALSTNAKSTVTLDKDNQFPMPFEASTSYLQIREILFSMIDKAILSPKMNGSPHVQVPITGWENMGDRELLQKIDGKWTKINKKKYLKLSDEEKSKVVITDTTLKFYTREKPYCEILLPHWFKEKLGKNSKFKDEKVLLAYLNTEEGRKILSGIGFRIPTQSLSSMEVFRVKGFLPASMGSTVVVPSEIVTKAGSDFDIDKLNMYLKSIYIDVNGNIRLVEYKDSEEATREFYSNLFDQKLSKKIVTKKELIEAAIIYASQGEDPKNLVEKYGYILDTLTEEYDSKDAYIEALEDQLDELGDTNFQEQLKEKFVDEMYKRSLENEYYDSLEKIITLPENFDRLISPVDDAGLEDVSKELDDLAGIDEANIPNRILNRNYMTALRHAFVIAKRWVGIAAVNITGQSLTQKSQVYIDPSRFGKLSKSDKKILGDGSIALDHNTTMVDGVSRISMSGVKTADDKHYISSRLSGYITSFVDVAKNPYILKIIKSNLIVGTFMFLERIGVGENAAFFLNQPIISDYLKYLDSIDSKTLFSPKNIKFIKASYGDNSSGGFDISLLKENIKNGGTNRAEQVAIFDEFLKYAKMAEFSFKLTQASNYDTSKIRSSGALLKKRILTDKARKSNIFSSVDNILNNSFIAEQSSFASKGFEALGEILKFDQPKFRDIINKVLTPFASRDFMSDDDYARIENKIVASFVDYVIQIKSNITSEIKELLISPDTTVASQLVKAKQDYPDMKILNDLQVASSQRLDNGAKSIKLGVNIKEAYDEDLYIGMMRELRDTEGLNDLYRNILKVAILQGTYQSAISLKNIIPIEDYSAKVAPIISKLTDDLDVQAFAKGWFQRNNFKGEDVFKTATPKFFHTSSSYETGPVPIFVDNFGNETYLYYSYSFPFLESMQLGGLDRKILVLNETFNYLDVQSDYVKVMRVVIDRKTGEKIDMETGETVLPSAYSEAKKKGDLSLRNIYGYEKVKHDDGTPLTFITDYKGDDMVNHVYKLINLYGENPFVTEHRSTFEPSEIDNGTIKIKNEIPNDDIINYFVSKYPSQALQSEFTEEEVSEAVIDEPRNGEPRIGEITKNKDGSYNVMLFEGTSSDWKDNVLEVKILPNGKFQIVAFGMRELLKEDLEERFGKSIISKISSLVTQSVNESSESTMAITNFYELLTQEEKDKLGSIEDIISDYESIPFDSSYEDYIESLKCKL